MNEPLAAVEDMIRELAEDVSPAISLRQRILTASHNARVRQLRRVQIQRAAGGFVASLCLMCVGILVQSSFLHTLGSPHDHEQSVVRVPVLENSRGLMNDATNADVSQVEVSTGHLSDPIEWETANSCWRRRDRQSALISRYF